MSNCSFHQVPPCVFCLIPAYKPPEELVSLVSEIFELARDDIPQIVVVDDGSGELFEPVFEKLNALSGVTVIKHAINMGKGAALKTGFNHILTTSPSVISIVTADADGQHAPADIVKVVRIALENPDQLIIGTRSFQKEVPFRSRIGNILTRMIYGLLTGVKLIDTQSGLRVWPKRLATHALSVNSNRYEFEMECLISFQRIGTSIPIEVPIRTIYEERNQSSHFNPLTDSALIYFVFLRYFGASIATVLVDYCVFFIAFGQTSSLGISLFFARSVATLLSFVLSRRFVFKSQAKWWQSFVKFVATIIVFSFISFAGIQYLTAALKVNLFLSKIIVEGMLYLCGFAVLNQYVFPGQTRLPEKKTDWDTYYAKPFGASRLTREMTSSVLKKLIRQFVKDEGRNIAVAELGGANSCFFSMLQNEFTPNAYHVFDNNQNGLTLFDAKFGKCAGVQTHSLDLSQNGPCPDIADLCFSVGLIEHFNVAETRTVIKHHFISLRSGGIAIISFPTPTFLYRAVRAAAELLGQWKFHDERPLKREEILLATQELAEVIHERIIWPIILTQRIMVFRKL